MPFSFLSDIMANFTVKEPAPEKVAEAKAATTAARKIMEEARQRAQNAFVDYEFMGVPMFIKKMSYMDNTDLALTYLRDGVNVLQLDLSKREIARSITICMLMICVYTEENGKKVPAFTHDSLKELTDLAGSNELIEGLWKKANEVNPMIFTTLKKIVSESQRE